MQAKPVGMDSRESWKQNRKHNTADARRVGAPSSEAGIVVEGEQSISTRAPAVLYRAREAKTVKARLTVASSLAGLRAPRRPLPCHFTFANASTASSCGILNLANSLRKPEVQREENWEPQPRQRFSHAIAPVRQAHASSLWHAMRTCSKPVNQSLCGLQFSSGCGRRRSVCLESSPRFTIKRTNWLSSSHGPILPYNTSDVAKYIVKYAITIYPPIVGGDLHQGI